MNPEALSKKLTKPCYELYLGMIFFLPNKQSLEAFNV